MNLDQPKDELLTNNSSNKNNIELIKFEKACENQKNIIDIIDNFYLLYKPAKCITWLKSRVNGNITELYYKKEEYFTTAILKSSKYEKSDNLLYEGIVGLFINKLTKIYPCFVETYGLYCYNNDTSYSKINCSEYIEPVILQTELTKVKNIDKSTLEKAFTHPLLFTIIIRNIPNSKTLNNLLKTNNDFIINDLSYVLFQIYAPLCVLFQKFTHYDLHLGNVLLHELKENSHIEYHYELNGTRCAFKCKYIAKIIDYGRSYFNDETDNEVTSSSKKIYEQLLKIPTFKKKKDLVGFQWFDTQLKQKNYFISSIVRNASHDLKLLNDIKLNYAEKIKQYNPAIYEILNYVKYGEGIRGKNYKQYGTKENITQSIPHTINNLLDLFRHLTPIITNKNQKEKNEEKYKDSTKLGDLYIYLNPNKPMEFIPVK